MDNTHKRYAVIVGISRYEDQISPLPCAENDAKRLAKALTGLGGFTEQCVYVLANADDSDDQRRLSPTRANILQKLQYVSESAGEEDLILFFFAGHGAEISKTPYLLAEDTRMDVLQHTAVNVATVNEILESSKARCILKVFDACRSQFAEGRGAVGRMTQGLQDAMLKVGSGWASFSSCSSGEVAYESGEFGHGVFSQYLCAGLEGKAASESGDVTFDRLVDYVQTSVANWCDEQSQRQTPHVLSNLSGSVVLTRVSARKGPVLVDSGNPMKWLEYEIGRHLAGTSEDARNLSATTADELRQFSELLKYSLTNLVQEFSHPAVRLQVSDGRHIQACGHAVWSEFNENLATRKVQQEYRDPAAAFQLSFSSAEVVVPRSTLTIAAVRFSFFYWLWYRHECSTECLQGVFTPTPNVSKGFFTLKPKDALDGRKVDDCIKEVLKRSGDNILIWAGQLRQFVESRMAPFRELGTIID